MKVEELKKILTKIKNSDDKTEVIENLLLIEQDYNTIINTLEENKINLENITKERDNYAKLNNELWLQNKAQKQDDKKDIEPNPEPPKKRTFGDLETILEKDYK